MTPPKCRLCGKEHWARQGCQFAAVIKGSKHTIQVDGIAVPRGSILLVSKPNTSQRPAGGTSTGEQTTAEKVTPGKRKTAPRKRKAKRKGKRK